MAKKAIQLKDYKVAKGKNSQGVEQAGHDIKKCIVHVSNALFDFLGAPEYIPTPGDSIPIEGGVNVTERSEIARGTFHGKTIIIGTDGEGGETYKKTYYMQIPNSYPIQFVRDWLQERQASTSNAISYVKIRNGFRYPVPVNS